MNVLVIPEDFRKDQYLLLPIIRAMLGALGRGSAQVVICRDPLLGGYGQALKRERILEIVNRYRMVDLFLLCVDRDGLPGRVSQLAALENDAATLLPSDKVLLGENAWQEIEVWALAGIDLPKEWTWTDVRAEISVKEVYFDDLARQRQLAGRPDGGRIELGREAAGRYGRIRQLCPEDVQRLESRISAWLEKK